MAFTPNIQEGKIGQFEQYISVPSAIWTVTHNLGKRPAVITIDSAGTQIFRSVKYLTINSLQITFAGSTSGYVYLS